MLWEGGELAEMYMVVLLQYALENSYSVSDTPHGAARNLPESLRLTVSVFLSTFWITTLILKKFHLHLQRDTLVSHYSNKAKHTTNW